MEWLDWHGCYDQGWGRGVLPKAAFAHPAKFSRGLAQRILTFGLERGFWKPGDLIGDPFAGVGCGGILAAYAGLRWVGVELEPRFVALAEEAFALHRHRWERLGCKLPRVVQGDSRRFAEIVAGAAGAVTSPPFSPDQPCPSQTQVLKDDGAIKTARKRDQVMTSPGQIQGLPVDGALMSPPYADSLDHPPGNKNFDGQGTARHCGQIHVSADYGTTPGQLGNLPAGDVQGVVTSPLYAGGGHHPDQMGAYNANGGGQGMTKDQHGYGESAGQIGRLRAGDVSGEEGRAAHSQEQRADRVEEVQGVVTSPPYENSMESGDKLAHIDFSKCTDRRKVRQPSAGTQGQRSESYWLTDGQVGLESGETYWEACRTVYRSVHQALKPGGVMACVVKSYVRDGAVVDLPGQTAALLEAVGFDVFLRCRCWLVEEWQEPDLFDGAVKKKRSRKSFFRRLQEKRPGAPRIDWECVLWARRL